MAKILLVDDDNALAEMVCDALEAERYEVDWAADGSQGWAMLSAYKYDVLILDWQMPGKSGVELCREYRGGGGSGGVLMLTGKGSLSDKETGLDAGADDYLTKPFDSRELKARVRALLRRPAAFKSDVLKVRDVELDSGSRQVTKGGAEVHLIPREFALLHFFMKHPNQVFSTEALLDRVWSNESDAMPNAIRKCVERLRKKLDSEGQSSLIETVHGVGYMLKN
jgi:DNA-binding response OmpR family regulator